MRNPVKRPRPSALYTRDCKWIERHYRRLSTDYPNKWVAVHGGRVVATGDNLGQAKRAAEALVGELEFPIQFVDDGTTVL